MGCERIAFAAHIEQKIGPANHAKHVPVGYNIDSSQKSGVGGRDAAQRLALASDFCYVLRQGYRVQVERISKRSVTPNGKAARSLVLRSERPYELSC